MAPPSRSPCPLPEQVAHSVHGANLYKSSTRTGINVALPPDIEADDVENGRPQAAPLLAMDTPMPTRSGGNHFADHFGASGPAPSPMARRALAPSAVADGGIISNELLSMKLDLVLQQLGSAPPTSPAPGESRPTRPPRQLPGHLDADTMAPTETSAI